MSGFVVDHVVIRTPDADGFARTVAREAGLAVLQGYAAEGVVQSRGVRFANGPFLDVFASAEPAGALILGGSINEAERLATRQDWGVRMIRRGESAAAADFPWSMALFRRGQGLLTQIGVIDYAPEPEAWAPPGAFGPLYRADPAARARLARVWLSAVDVDRAARDLGAFGYRLDGEAVSDFWPHTGRRLTGRGADLVVFSGEDGVARLDIASGAGPARELVPPQAPRLVFGERS